MATQLRQAVVPSSYWLGRCEGFHVYSPDGYEGVVTCIHRDAAQRPELLEILAGLFVPRSVFVRIEDVDRIVARERRVVLLHTPGEARLE